MWVGMVTNSTPRRINWFAIILGVVTFCIQLPFLSLEIKFVKTSKVVPAEVVKLNAGGKHPQVEFTTLDGQNISVPASSWSSVSVGDTVEVRYDPKHPRIAKMNTLWGVWGLHLMVVWVSAGFILGGLLGFPSKDGWRSEGNIDA